MMPSRYRYKPPTSKTAIFRDLRAEAIDETNVFLTWALSKDRNLPRIPVARVDQGGFSRLMENSGARQLVVEFWNSILERANL